jgi:hypothetical protein
MIGRGKSLTKSDPKISFVGRAFAGYGKSQFKAAFSSTGTLACAGFAAFFIDAQPRVAVLLNFSRSLFSRDFKTQ